MSYSATCCASSGHDMNVSVRSRWGFRGRWKWWKCATLCSAQTWETSGFYFHQLIKRIQIERLTSWTAAFTGKWDISDLSMKVKTKKRERKFFESTSQLFILFFLNGVLIKPQSGARNILFSHIVAEKCSLARLFIKASERETDPGEPIRTGQILGFHSAAVKRKKEWSRE